MEREKAIKKLAKSTDDVGISDSVKGFEELPTGIEPHWLVNNSRIAELGRAITRYANFITERPDLIQYTSDINAYKLISSWAEEIRILASAELHLDRPFQ